jgi:hypothetical protein
MYNEHLESELQVTKALQREKEQELHSIKSDCAATLLEKERSHQAKLQDIQKEIVDLQYQN